MRDGEELRAVEQGARLRLAPEELRDQPGISLLGWWWFDRITGAAHFRELTLEREFDRLDRTRSGEADGVVCISDRLPRDPL